MAVSEAELERVGWLSVRKAARYMHRGLGEFEALVRSGAIPCYQPGRHRLVHTSDIDAYVRKFPYRLVEVA